MSAADPVVAPPRPTPTPDASPSKPRPAWLAVVVLLAAGLVVFFPAIRSPPFLDDYFQTSMIEGTYPAPRSPLDLYNFVGDADRSILRDRGLIPWWSHPRLKVRFLRPLSSALLFADHRVLGNRPLLAHLHSFAWWAAAVFAARALYRRTLAPRAALLGTFIFALASCHAFPLLWLANREVLVSATFGILALTALVRLREEWRVSHAVSAALFFSLSLLGGEYALCFGGYALALALTGRRSTRAERVWGLLAFAVPAVVFLVVRSKLGYGTEGSGFYHDPFVDPLGFIHHVPGRLVTLFAEGWFTLDSDTISPSTAPWVLGLFAAVGVAILVGPLRRTLASLDAERRDHATWLLVGSVLSLGPVLAVMPAPRVLCASFLGIAATVALILEHAWFPPASQARANGGELTRVVALGLGFAHLVHGPGMAWLMSRACRNEALIFADRAADLRARIANSASTEVVLIRSLAVTVFALPYALDAKGTPPDRWRLLDFADRVLMLRRDARTIDLVVPRDRSLFPIGEGNLFRGEGAPFAKGDVVRVSGMRATVMEIGDVGPRLVRLELDDALESPSRIWVNDRFDGFHDATPPALGFGKPFDNWPSREDPRPQ